MSSRINKHGMLIDRETIVLLKTKDIDVKIEISQYKNSWHYGIDLRLGGVRTGAFGFAFSPSPKWNTQKTRLDAVTAAKLHIAERLENKSERNPVIKKFINQIVTAARQGSLF